MARKRVSTAKVISKEIKNVFNRSVSIPDGLITNDTIRQTFFDHLKKSTYIPSSILPKIWNLIEEQVIIPVNVKRSGLLSMLFSRLKSTPMPMSYSKDTMAFYSGSSNRVYMLIDNMLRVTKNSNLIASTLVHELQHMQCHNFPSEFFAVHKEMLTTYYHAMFSEAINLYDDAKNSNITANRQAAAVFCKYCIYMFDDLISDSTFKMSAKDFYSYYIRCFNVFDHNERDRRAESIVNRLAAMIVAGGSGILSEKYWSEARNNKSDAYFCYRCCGWAYDKIGMNPNRLDSFFGQELIFPSEVISVVSAVKITPAMFAFINRL